MKYTVILTLTLLLTVRFSYAQQEQKVAYIVDSVTVVHDPEPGNEILQDDIADVTIIKNKDTLKLLGFENFDAAAYLFTKAYRSRPEEIRKIPSTYQMKKTDSLWYFRDAPYTGPVINYYYSGKKFQEGTFKDGKAEGTRKMYFQNGKVLMERSYSNGREHGLEQEYYRNGALKQKGEFVNGKEEGVWEIYFPNGQIKQRSTFKNGQIDGETTIYYSSGKVLAVEVTKKGKTSPDKRLDKIHDALKKSQAKYREGDTKTALKYCTKAIETDSTYAEAYFNRGTIKLNNLQFDEAIADFDKALSIEPYFYKAMTNRAYAKIRKCQFSGSRQLGSTHGVRVLATKKDTKIPEQELTLICGDLKQAYFLGDDQQSVTDGLAEFCGGVNAQ
ncbi:tetratricopeptide repeat protein [Chitinophaga sp. GCM10012297]|uniref:Tetratricopeptide repeat protein n=1 Tax=Chitinophaga chungangae TaxID=2821488 RepID=A0ABS3YJ92_9BACT|nr:toxin-antitoxin system YwqK family antitoxin [Chitinophaga chungangae]MBO9154758.1 tetratricopeptide repeat protein [Chitinophaga chungangae]